MSDPQMNDPDAGGAGSEYVDTPEPSRQGGAPPGAVAPEGRTRRDVYGSPVVDDDADVSEDSPLRPNTTY